MKKIAFLLLVATFLMQWFVPVNMIMQQEDILKEGTTFKFKTQPIDPNDPFRGKFIVLNYEANNIDIKGDEYWYQGEPVYVKIKEDEKGFAQIAGLEKTLPVDDNHYIKAEIERVWGENPSKIRIKYPFERFYMEENKAPKAEALFGNMRRDTNTVIYSLVVINKGRSALKDVVVNGVSIKDAVENAE